MRIRIENANLFDGIGDALQSGLHVLVADGRIAEVSDRALTGGAELVIDASGLTLTWRSWRR